MRNGRSAEGTSARHGSAMLGRNYREVNEPKLEPKLFELFVNASGAIRATTW